MTDLVDQMFPPIHRKWAPEYTDFNYWKAPMQDFDLPDLSPPSPALSARSDVSTLSRIRNFSLVGSRQSNVPRQIASRETSPQPEEIRLQQMTSFERLSNTLGFRSGASSPTSLRSRSPDSRSSYAVSEVEEGESEWRARRRERTTSMTSMPGSLDDVEFTVDEADEEEDGDDDDEDNIEDDLPEDHFDDDILAEGEMMQKVPFL
jgi:phosphatidate phosphatase LPIN